MPTIDEVAVQCIIRGGQRNTICRPAWPIAPQSIYLTGMRSCIYSTSLVMMTVAAQPGS